MSRRAGQRATTGVAGLAIAAVVACCNALSSAWLAARYPQSGGTYVYGRERLGPWWGFAAGWSFCIGKTASCAAMALTVAAYAVPTGWQRPVAAAVVGAGDAASAGNRFSSQRSTRYSSRSIPSGARR